MRAKTAPAILGETVIDGSPAFTWMPPLSIVFHLTRVFWLLFYICSWAGLTTAPVVFLARGDGPPYWLVPILPAFWALLSAGCFWCIRPMLRMRPASLVLEPHELRYDPGDLAAVLLRVGFCMFFFMDTFRSIRRRTRGFAIPRSELCVRLTDEIWCGRGRRLVVARRGGEEMAIGLAMTDAERGRIFDAVERWRHEPPRRGESAWARRSV